MSNPSSNDNNPILELFEAQSMMKHLRILLFSYLENADDFPVDFKELLYDVNLLFEFLEDLNQA